MDMRDFANPEPAVRTGRLSRLRRPRKPDDRTWIGFAMMCIGMFMAILDVQVVATSLPTIQSALTSRPTR